VLHAYEAVAELTERALERTDLQLVNRDRSWFRTAWYAVREAEAVLGAFELADKEAEREVDWSREETDKLGKLCWPDLVRRLLCFKIGNHKLCVPILIWR
jgi:hypothetical protein